MPRPGQKRRKEEIAKAIGRSVRAEKPRAKSEKQARKDSLWKGAKVNPPRGSTVVDQPVSTVKFPDDLRRVAVRSQEEQEAINKFAKYRDGMSDEMRRDLNAYTRGADFDDDGNILPTGSFEEVNSMLRECPETLDCLHGRAADVFRSMTRAIESSGVQDEPTFVYRGVKGDSQKSKDLLKAARKATTKKALSAGEVMEMSFDGLVSTSLDPEIAVEFSGEKRGYLFEIAAKTGAYINPVSSSPNELELVQGHNTRYRVVGVEKKKLPGSTERTVIQIEEIVR